MGDMTKNVIFYQGGAQIGIPLSRRENVFSSALVEKGRGATSSQPIEGRQFLPLLTAQIPTSES
jgi:hypothetical protein